MKDKLMIVRIDSNYCDYLRQFDNKVPFNFKSKELRPFIGVLFSIDDLMYFAPLSSPKAKHLNMKDKLDFMRIDSGNLGAINFNNMLPVKDKNIIEIDLNKKGNSKVDDIYNNMLRKQLRWLNRNKNKLYGKANKLYDLYINNKLPSNIFDRCCNFKLLEEKCKLYK